MKCVTFDGLGEYLFYDVKYDADKTATDHSLNDPRFAGASIMLSNEFWVAVVENMPLNHFIVQVFEQLLRATSPKFSLEIQLT